jgi:hypothetical protein
MPRIPFDSAKRLDDGVPDLYPDEKQPLFRDQEIYVGYGGSGPIEASEGERFTNSRNSSYVGQFNSPLTSIAAAAAAALNSAAAPGEKARAPSSAPPSGYGKGIASESASSGQVESNPRSNLNLDAGNLNTQSGARE